MVPREVEFKLDIGPADVARMTKAAGRTGKRAGTKTLKSVYFDTDDQQLRKAGFSLRVRHDGDRRIQTIKTDGGVGAGWFDRAEWEHDIDNDTPELGWRPLSKAVGRKALRRLAPVFSSTVDRATMHVTIGDAEIELAIDRGEVSSPTLSVPLSEVELELKHGDPASLFALARQLDVAAPVRLGVLTKSERGYRVLDQNSGGAAKAEPIILDAGMTAATAFRTIAWSCLRQFRLNETAAANDPAALHQARVALRRLRSALSLFKWVAADGRFDHLRAELRWLAATLGDARNLDVLIERTDDKEALQRLQPARETAYSTVAEALGSTRSRALMIDLAEWLTLGEWLAFPATADRREQGIKPFAVDRLKRLRKRLKRDGRGLARLDDDRRHAVRIEAKKLRYATEFFASLFPGRKAGKRRKRFRDALETLQTWLGDLNDLATAPLVMNRFALDPEIADPATRDTLVGRAGASYGAVIDIKRFW